MYIESSQKVANEELAGRDSLPFSILSKSYRNMEDRPRLLVIEEMLKAADDIPTDQLTFSEIEKRLSKVKMSAEKRSLIPEIIEELRTAASQGATELRPERPFRNIFCRSTRNNGNR